MYDFLILVRCKNTYFNFDSVGRIDDVVVHSSGEKTVPARIEEIVTSST